MGNMTLSIPDDLLKTLKKHSYIKWSEVARIAFQEKIDTLEKIDILKEFEDAEKDYKDGKNISFEKVVRDLGLENEIGLKNEL